MEKRKVLLFTLMFGLLATLTACNKNSVNNSDYYSDVGNWKVPKSILPETASKQSSRPSIQVIEDNLAILTSARKKITLYYKDKEYVIDPSAGATNLWLFTDKTKKNMYIFWWRKTREGKRLYFKSTTDLGKTFSETVVVNTAGGILPRIRFAASGDGQLSVIYYDERNPPYEIYANYSTDYGVTWNDKDFRLDNDTNSPLTKLNDGSEVAVNYSIDPMLAHLESGKLVAVWQQRKILDGKYVSQFVSRQSNDFGKTWLKEQLIYSSDGKLTVEAELIAKGNNVVLVAAYPIKGLLGFVGTASMASDQISWIDAGGAPGTENVNQLSWMRHDIAGDHYKVAYIIKKDERTKNRIEVASMSLKEGRWGEKAFRLDRNKKQSIETEASYLDLKALPNGEFVVAWEDYQTFIPLLMLDYTNKQGTEWQESPIPLTRGGLSQIKYPKIKVGADKVRLIFEWDIIRDKKLPTVAMLELPIDKKSGELVVHAAPEGPKFSKQEMESKLRKRAQDLMDFRVKREWEKTWDFMDPVFRQVTSKEKWLRNVGFVTYEDANVKSVDVDGRFGVTQIEMSIALREQIRSGELMEATPPKKTTTNMNWLWFYDDWYFFSSNSFIRYLTF